VDLKALAKRVLQRDTERDSQRDSSIKSVPGLIHSVGHFSTDPFDPPVTGYGPEWRRWFSLLVEQKKELGHPPAFAARLAYGEALTVWHLHHGDRPDPPCCAGCGDPVANPVHTLPDGALICPADDCLIAYGEKWRAAAASALAALGVVPCDE
jgi:hypothetical protein